MATDIGRAGRSPSQRYDAEYGVRQALTPVSAPYRSDTSHPCVVSPVTGQRTGDAVT